MTPTKAEVSKEKKVTGSTTVETEMDDLTMVSLLWMGASANAVRHHVPKGIARIHAMSNEDDDGA